MVTRRRLAYSIGVAMIPAVAGAVFLAVQRLPGDETPPASPAASRPKQDESAVLDLAANRLLCEMAERHVSEATFDGDAHWEVRAQCLVDAPGGTHLTRNRYWRVADDDLSISSSVESNREPPTSCRDPYTLCIGEPGPKPQITIDLTVTPLSPRTPMR